MLAQGYTANLERIVTAVVERLLARYDAMLEELGPKPFGFVQANKWERLEAYLDQMRGDPFAWQNAVAYYRQQHGNLAAAITQVMKEATAMERSLALEGGWDRTSADYARAVLAGATRVRAEMFARRTGDAERAMRDVEKQDRLPKPLVGPEIPPPPPFGAAVPEGPIAQPAPVGMAPLPQMGMAAVQQFTPPVGAMG